MGRIPFSFKTKVKQLSGTTLGNGAKFAATDWGIEYTPAGYTTPQLHFTWPEAWALYQFLDTINGPTTPPELTPPPEAKL